MGSIPGIKSFSINRNANLRRQLEEYMIRVITHRNSFSRTGGLSIWLRYDPVARNKTIHYQTILDKDNISMTIYDFRGKKISVLYSGVQRKGVHQFVWNTDFFASGAYTIILTGRDGCVAKKITINR